jgi:hypothetical protein
VGKRLPTLERWLHDPATHWTALPVSRWYSEKPRIVEIVSQTAVWYHTGLPPVPIRWILSRDPLGKFATQALLCTDLAATPLPILSWFVLRWQMEVTFHAARAMPLVPCRSCHAARAMPLVPCRSCHAARAHLGVETQRQWSEQAIARTTPVLLGLFSLVTLLAHALLSRATMPLQQAAWYRKTRPTFSDA